MLPSCAIEKGIQIGPERTAGVLLGDGQLVQGVRVADRGKVGILLPVIQSTDDEFCACSWRC